MMQDRLEKEKADSKNAVEEYVYEMRDKLSSTLESYIKENERESFMKTLNETEDWLYDDGEDLSKKYYIDKLADLKVRPKLGTTTRTSCTTQNNQTQGTDTLTIDRGHGSEHPNCDAKR